MRTGRVEVSMHRSLTWLLAICLGLAGCAVVQNAETRNDVERQRADLTQAALQCHQEMVATSDLEPILGKIELDRPVPDSAPPFSITSDDTFATDAERQAIKKWASLRDECARHRDTIIQRPIRATPYVHLLLDQEFAVAKDGTASVDQLILALYERKLSYGEFASKRYELGREMMAAFRAIRQSAVTHDEQVSAQAQEQFARNLEAWSTYLQAVNARQPQTVVINGTLRVQ